MAVLSVSSNLVSRSAHLNHGPSVSSDSKVTSSVGIRFLKQTNTHNGLRILNPVDELLHSTPIKASSRQARRTRAFKCKGTKPSDVIVCGMNLIFVGTEVGPWSKTGGLGDVLGGLPPAMAANGHRVMTIAPRYDQYKDAWDTDVTIEVKVGDRVEKVRFFHCYKRGVDRVFVDHPMFLEKVWGKTGTKLYGPYAGEDYEENQLRFSLFCQAALEAPRVLNLNSSSYFSGPYGEDVIFIANDWHTALVPCYLKSMYKPLASIRMPKLFSASTTLLTKADSHSTIFLFSISRVSSEAPLNSSMGILNHPYYANELASGVEKGVELDHIIRRTGIIGIINGMDVQEWNPSADKYINVKYNASTVLTAKPLLKETLQAEVGLPVDRDVPLIAFIGRLEEQKGSDILVEAIPQFIDENVQLVALGTGKKQMEKQLQQLETLYPDKARGVAKFNVPLAHMMIAGADYILVPSRFEPCGLIQLQAMRYGTVPIVASTGGLVDTVKEGFTGFQMGPFNVECEAVDPADAAALATNVKRALKVYGTPALTEMISNCMAQDLSWKGPAKKWEEVLLSLGVAGSEPGIEGEEIAPQAKENVAAP
ncbi:hypothetical protein K1719_041242 [Acacia pycnantha]|nr:hypothetical protein K1719_041242 [Acacia pycnantha]